MALGRLSRLFGLTPSAPRPLGQPQPCPVSYRSTPPVHDGPVSGFLFLLARQWRAECNRRCNTKQKHGHQKSECLNRDSGSGRTAKQVWKEEVRR